MRSEFSEGLLRRVWRALPRRQRHLSLFWALYPLASIRGPSRSAAPAVCVAGPLSAPTGIARSARANLSVLRRASPHVAARDLSRMLGYTRPVWPELDALPRGSAGTPATHLILHANPLQIPICAMRLGLAWRNAWRIGLWAWELPSVPAEWRAAAHLVDEIWVPSSFVETALRSCGIDKPIRVMPPPVLALDREDGARRASPAHVPGTRERLRFLMAFDARSGFWRKNPVDAVRAFRKTLAGAADAELIVKVTGADRHPAGMEKLKYAIGGSPNIKVLTDVLSDAEMAALVMGADVVLSTHRSEGFGLTILEGMLHGRAVVATGWSGNMDFMNEKNSIPLKYSLTPVFDPDRIYPGTDNVWAQPDLRQLCDVLDGTYRDRGRLASLGRAARASAERFCRDAERRQRQWLDGVVRGTGAAVGQAAAAGGAEDDVRQSVRRRAAGRGR